MEQKYDIAIVGEELDRPLLKALTRESVDETIAARRSIIRSFAIEHPRETLIFAVGQAKKQLVALYKQAGIILEESEIPDVVFIDGKMRAKLAKAMEPHLGFKDSEIQAGSGVCNGVSVVFIDKGLTDLEYAKIIFHEIFHLTGTQIIAANRQVWEYVRQGLEVVGIRSSHKPWLLEEGLIEFWAVRFLDKLADNSYYRQEIEERAREVKRLERKTMIVNGRIVLPDGTNIEPGYLFLVRGRVTKGLAVRPNESFAASLFELIASRFQGDEQNKFFNAALAARRDPKLIKELAGLIDSRWGEGTYAKMLKCPRKPAAVWNLICELDPARAIGKRQPLYERLISVLKSFGMRKQPA